MRDTVIDATALLLPSGFVTGAADVVRHAAEDGVTCGNPGTGRVFQVARNIHRTF